MPVKISTKTQSASEFRRPPTPELRAKIPASTQHYPHHRSYSARSAVRNPSSRLAPQRVTRAQINVAGYTGDGRYRFAAPPSRLGSCPLPADPRPRPTLDQVICCALIYVELKPQLLISQHPIVGLLNINFRHLESATIEWPASDPAFFSEISQNWPLVFAPSEPTKPRQPPRPRCRIKSYVE